MESLAHQQNCQWFSFAKNNLRVAAKKLQPYTEINKKIKHLLNGRAIVNNAYTPKSHYLNRLTTSPKEHIQLP